MKWVKYRHKFSYKFQEWGYYPLYINGSDKELEEYVQEELKEKTHDMYYDESEHYRGFDFEIVEHANVPDNLIKEEINKLQMRVKYLNGCLKMLKEINNT